MEQEYLTIYADIPSNFTIEKAFITLRHQPITWHYYANIEATSESVTVGYARNVQIYTDSLKPKEDIYVDSELMTEKQVPRNCYNCNGKQWKNIQLNSNRNSKIFGFKKLLIIWKPISISHWLNCKSK